MSAQVNFLLPYFISLVISSLIGIYAWSRREARGAAWFALVAFIEALCIFFYLAEISAVSLKAKIIFDDIQNIGYSLWFLVLLAFALSYSGRLTRRVKILLLVAAIPGALFAGAVIYSDLLGQVESFSRSNVRLLPGPSFTHLTYEFTPADHGYFIYCTALQLAGIVVLARQLFGAPAGERGRDATILLGMLIPFLGMLVTFLELSPFVERDMSPFSFTLGNVVLAIGLFRYRLFDVVPIGRRMVIDGMTSPVAVFDEEDRVLDLNPAAAAFMGHKLSKLKGRPIQEVFSAHPALVEAYRNRPAACGLLELKPREEPRQYELELEDLHDDGGHTRGRLLILTDVTERETARRILQQSRDDLEERVEERTRELLEAVTELKVSEDRFTKIFHAAPGLMALLDEPTGRVVAVNDNQERITGLPRDQVIGSTIRETGLITDETVLDRIDRLIAQQGRTGRIETGIFTPTGEERILRLSIQSIGLEGQAHLLVVGDDVTERKQVEDRLIQAQKMEAIGTLAGGIAHDFNNLLMAIQGHASLAMIELDRGRSNRGRIESIENLVQKSTDLTRQLLGLARGGKYEVKVTDLNQLVQEAAEIFGRTKKEIRIETKYREGLPVVEVDRGQIEQVMLNLFLNAWQAMPTGGVLFLSTEPVRLDPENVEPYDLAAGDFVKVSVTDTGVGIDPETLPHIFEPFFTTKRAGKGTGLGLASAYGIVANHGGFITVYSQKGEGATFNVYLPVSYQGAVEEKPVAAQPFKGEGTVLVVDDEPMILDVSANLLESLGFKVLRADSGIKALEIYQESKEEIQLIILDMIMPEMSGGMVFDRIREINPQQKIVLCSGYSMNGQAVQILQRGCSGFLQKPFNLSALSAKLQEVLSEC